MDIKEKLNSLRDDNYREFQSKLIPDLKKPIIGVRLPVLRKLAKEEAKKDYKEFLNQCSDDTYEEIMVQGFVIGCASISEDERFLLIERFLPKIDNWAVCDGFCGSLKFTKKCRERMWKLMEECMESGEEYKIRFAMVMMLDYYADEEYCSKAFQYFDRNLHEGYYVKMAAAWAISQYFVKVREKTMAYLKNTAALDEWTYQKSLQKILESYRVSPEDKAVIQEMKSKRKSS